MWGYYMHHFEYSLTEDSSRERNNLEGESFDVMWEGRKSPCYGVQKYNSWPPVWLQHPRHPVTGSQTFSHRYPCLQVTWQKFEGEPGATSYNHHIPLKLFWVTLNIYWNFLFKLYVFLVFKWKKLVLWNLPARSCAMPILWPWEAYVPPGRGDGVPSPWF